ncbi:MAG: LysE family transporter [Actinomycetota bacterium]
MTFSLVLLGFALNLLFVLPPGPLAVTLVEVGVSQGRAAGARSGIGIAAGDLAVGSAAGLLVVSGGVLPDGAFGTVQVVSAVALIAIGVAMAVRPSTVESVAGAIQRPVRAFFLLTVLTPTVFGAWIAIITALPFADDFDAILAFVIGAGIASAAYHVALGSAAGEVGRHVSGPVMIRVAQAGGVLFAGVGVLMLLG